MNRAKKMRTNNFYLPNLEARYIVSSSRTFMLFALFRMKTEWMKTQIQEWMRSSVHNMCEVEWFELVPVPAMHSLILWPYRRKRLSLSLRALFLHIWLVMNYRQNEMTAIQTHILYLIDLGVYYSCLRRLHNGKRGDQMKTNERANKNQNTKWRKQSQAKKNGPKWEISTFFMAFMCYCSLDLFCYTEAVCTVERFDSKFNSLGPKIEFASLMCCMIVLSSFWWTTDPWHFRFWASKFHPKNNPFHPVW